MTELLHFWAKVLNCLPLPNDSELRRFMRIKVNWLYKVQLRREGSHLNDFASSKRRSWEELIDLLDCLGPHGSWLQNMIWVFHSPRAATEHQGLRLQSKLAPVTLGHLGGGGGCGNGRGCWLSLESMSSSGKCWSRWCCSFPRLSSETTNPLCLLAQFY